MQLKRDPSVLLTGLIVPLVMAFTAFAFEGDRETAGIINGAAALIAGAIVAVMVKSDQQLPALTGAVQAVFSVAAAFGLDWSAEQQALVLAPIALVLSFVVRDRVAAPVAPVVTPQPAPVPNA